ncbi:NADH:flavin oxidoreductase [Anaeroselena agilis]|uniref:NADH:flavin oxidoreductase n=1 Tax=Anaeroselena agilis TaxID=3063788 RepID=A0ABU3P3A6_9FIRM|nr:NADH:flavin oxidoreductase [Selenomonadales bacterium 4137-cl]
MKTLFDSTTINGLPLANRFIRAATMDFAADERGGVTERMIAAYGEAARSQVGLIVTGWVYVLPDGQGLPAMCGIHDDSLLDGFRKLTDKVHAEGGKVVLQIGYGGPQSPYESGPDVYSPSAVPDLGTGRTGKAMTEADIARLTAGFATAAGRAKAAGFDGVEIHAAHGFLLSQFLSPYYNRRSDGYGGPAENRARLLLEVYEAIRRQTGPDFVILAKVNCDDFVDGGMSFADSLYTCRLLAEKGIDGLEISGGLSAFREKCTVRRDITSPDQEAYFAKYAARIANEVTAPVILVGGLRSPEVMKRLLQDTKIAYFSLCRPLIAEPRLLERWRSGDRSGARCVSCNKCLTPAGIRCAMYGEA